MSYYATFNNFIKSLMMTKPVLGCQANIKINILCNLFSFTSLQCSGTHAIYLIIS